MTQIPDADYIREAERNGMPHPDKPICPECGQECETVFVARENRMMVLGCDKCLMAKDAYDWDDERKERYKENL